MLSLSWLTVLRDARRYRWLRTQFHGTIPLTGSEAGSPRRIWHLPTATLLRFRAETVDDAIDAARHHALTTAGTPIWIGDDPH